MIDLEDVGHYVLKNAEKMNIDETEVYLLKKELLNTRLVSSQLEGKGTFDHIASIRVIKGRAMGFAATSKFAEESLRRTLSEALSNAKNSTPLEHWSNFPKAQKTPEIPDLFDKHISEISIEEIASLAIRMLDGAESVSAKIVDIGGSLNIVRQEVRILNSHGLNLGHSETLIAGLVTAELQEEGIPNWRQPSGTSFAGSRTLANFIPEEVGREAAEMATRSTGAKKVKDGEYSLILHPLAAAHIANVFTHHVSADNYQNKTSCLFGKLGQSVADESLTIVDDPLHIGSIGSKAFDDEGTPTQRLPLVEEGLLKNLIYDSFYASKDKVDSTGNGLRGWGMRPARMSPLGRGYNLPSPTPHNVVVKTGDWTEEELIKETKKGIVIGRFWGGAVRFVPSGDFSTASHKTEVHLVEDGEVKYPLTMVRITDSLPRALNAVSGISRKAKHEWTWLPSTSHIAPTIKIDGVKVVPI